MARAKNNSKSRGQPLAEFAGQGLRGRPPASNKAPWMRYAGFVASGDLASSQSIDGLVYGAKD